MPGDAQDGVAEAGGQVGEVHGVHALVQDQLPQVLKDLVNVGVTLGVAQEAPGASGNGHFVLGVILDVEANKALASGGETREESDLANHCEETGFSIKDSRLYQCFCCFQTLIFHYERVNLYSRLTQMPSACLKKCTTINIEKAPAMNQLRLSPSPSSPEREASIMERRKQFSGKGTYCDTF